MTSKNEPADPATRAKFLGTLIGAAVLSLLSSGVFVKFTGDETKQIVQERTAEVLKSSDTGTAVYLDALRDVLEARYALQNTRIIALERQVSALQAASSRRVLVGAPDRFEPRTEMPLPSFAVR